MTLKLKISKTEI